ncbi:MAG TPA: GTPase Era [Actinomycetota bacterium]|nr:GTPase Era [Actinomycetota bacterium]
MTNGAGDTPFRSGFVAVVGRPNVGKSTLVNALVGQKVAITSDKPQTTRSAIRGIVDLPEMQMVLIDTPGYHKPRTLLGRRLNEVVRSAWADVDLALFVVDGSAGIGRGDEKVTRDLAAAGCGVILVVNKIDRMGRDDVAAQLVRATELADFAEYVPVSAREGIGVSTLRDVMGGYMPPGPPYYPPGTRTDQPPPRFVAELVREKLLARMKDEVPHSIAVVTEEFEEREDGLLTVSAIVFVERDSQKGIVIGKGGSTLKAVGIESREEIELLFGRRVYLDLRVKVEKDWQRRAYALERLGLGDA